MLEGLSLLLPTLFFGGTNLRLEGLSLLLPQNVSSRIQTELLF